MHLPIPSTPDTALRHNIHGIDIIADTLTASHAQRLELAPRDDILSMPPRTGAIIVPHWPESHPEAREDISESKFIETLCDTIAEKRLTYLLCSSLPNHIDSLDNIDPDTVVMQVRLVWRNGHGFAQVKSLPGSITAIIYETIHNDRQSFLVVAQETRAELAAAIRSLNSAIN